MLTGRMPRNQGWTLTTRQACKAMAFLGGYPNLLAQGDVTRATKSYGKNAERLIRAKRLFDPNNVFCLAIPLPTPQDNWGHMGDAAQ
jgi:hypothetical protein